MLRRGYIEILFKTADTPLSQEFEATLAGYAEAARRGGQVLVKVDGDDQMDLGYMGQLVAPILLGEADYGIDPLTQL